METKPNPTRSPRPSKTTEKETYALSKYAPRDSPRSPTRFSSKVFGENTRNVIRSAHPSKIGAVEVTQILNPNFSSSSKDDVAMETNQGPRSSSPSKDFDMETGRRSRSLSRSSHRSANAYSSRSCNRFSERSSSPSRDIEMETALNDENVDLAWEVAAKAMTPDDMSEDPTTGGDVPGNHDDEIFSTAPVYREVSPTLAPLPQKEQKRKRSSSVSSVPVVQEPQDSLVSIASLGDVLITLNRPVKAGEDSKETAPVLEIKCASPDMSKAATGPAWKSLLSTGTKVNVPHTDDEFGLLFMLRVAHDRDLSKVYDSEFTLDQILGVTSMVHKYNASSNVRQELVARIPTAWKDPMHFVDRPEAARWLFVSWIFGFHATFQNLLRVLVRQTCVNQDGDLVDKNGNLLTGTFPTAVLGHIRETRMRYLQRLISTTYDYAEKLCDAETRTCTATSSTHDWEDCASLLTGSFLNGLGKIGFGLKMPAIDTIEYSINETEAKLRGTKGHQPTNSDQLSSFGKFHYVGLGCGEDIGGDLIPNCQNKCVVPAPGSSP